MTGAGRRWLLVAVSVLALVGAAVGGIWISASSSHGDPDPGGRLLAGVQAIESAVPADAEVMLRQANEARWDSCDGRPGTFGWDDVTMNLQFRTSEQPEALVAQVDQVLAQAGWQRADASPHPLGPVARWSRTLTGGTVATAVLSPGTRGDGDTYWDFGAAAPPHGPRAGGC